MLGTMLDTKLDTKLATMLATMLGVSNNHHISSVVARHTQFRSSLGCCDSAQSRLSGVNTADTALLVLRIAFGLSMAYHGYNKIFGPSGLAGTASWFSSMGMKAPRLQARLAAGTEIVAGLCFIAGLLTPFAAAAFIALMIVAIVTSHWKNGYFIFMPGGGWEYCASIIAVALAVAIAGPGRASLDHAFSIDWGVAGGIIAGGVGVISAISQLVIFYRPPSKSA
jgi:putative oxidoreductase